MKTKKEEVEVLSSKNIPPEFGNFAANRVEPLLKVWARRGELSLLELAASCYLQGVADGWQTVESVAPEAAAAFYKVIEIIKKEGKSQNENSETTK